MTDRIIEGKINSIQADLATHVKKKKNAWQLPFKANRENSWSLTYEICVSFPHSWFFLSISTHSTVGPAVNISSTTSTTWFPQLRGPDLFKPVCTAMVVPVWGKLRRGKLTSFLLGYLVLVQFSQNYHNTHQKMEIWKIPSFHFFRSHFLWRKNHQGKNDGSSHQAAAFGGPGGLEPRLVSCLCTQAPNGELGGAKCQTERLLMWLMIAL